MSGALGSSVNMLRTATKSALGRTRKIMGGSRSEDTQLKIYNKLKPENFNQLAELYGGEGVIRYIKHMEALRLNTSKGN
jgi:hypothetical protein